MGTIGTGVTYLDLASRLGPDNKVSTIIELLAQTNEILKDMVAVEGNLPTGHKTTIRTGLPSATWRMLNYGVQPSKSRTTQVTDTCGMLEAYAEVDKALADLNGNTAAFRLSEDRAFLEAMNQEMASVLFFGSQVVDPEKFTGFAHRYGGVMAASGDNDAVTAISTDSTEIGYNLISAWGAGATNDEDMYEAYLIVWGENTIHGIYPKGSQAGFQHQDLGEVTLTDSATPAGRYQGYRTHYKWDLGLCVRDWRYGVRVADIDLSGIIAETTTATLLDAMVKAYYKIPNINLGKAVWYMPTIILPYLQREAAIRGASQLTVDNPSGKPVVSHMGVPIRKCQALDRVYHGHFV